MKTCFEPIDPFRPRWQQRGIARLQRAWNHLKRLVMVEHRQAAALLPIPIRTRQPETLRQSKRSAWRD